MRDQLLHQLATRWGCTKLARGDCANTLAIRVICQTAKVGACWGLAARGAVVLRAATNRRPQRRYCRHTNHRAHAPHAQKVLCELDKLKTLPASSPPCQGRGHALPADVALMDARHGPGAPATVLPMRDLSAKELVWACRSVFWCIHQDRKTCRCVELFNLGFSKVMLCDT